MQSFGATANSSRVPNIGQALRMLKANGCDPHVQHLIDFVEGSSRGIVSAVSGSEVDPD